MKKNRFFWASAAIAALTLTACADQDEFNQNDVQTAAVENAPGAIQFGTYLGKEGTTRATIPQTYTTGTIGNKTDAVIGITDLKAAHFGVFGYFTGEKNYRAADYTWTAAGVWKFDDTNKYPNFFYNQEILFDDATGKNAWVYEPVKYWPNGVDAANSDSNPNVSNTPSNTATEGANYKNQKLSFFAYAPFIGTPTDAYADVAASDVKPAQITDEGWIKQVDATTNGIKAMTTNESKTDVWVKYLMPNATTSEAVDLLWGLAGKEAYKETDGWNPAKTIGDDYNENLTKQIVGERVKFLFKHALAKMGGATANGDETTANDPKKCGLMVVADVDHNSSTPAVDGQSKQGADYFPTDFNRQKTLITLKSVKIQDGKSANADNTTGVYNTGLESTLLTRGWFNIETGKWCEDDYTYGVGASGGATYNVTATSTNTDVNDETYTINDDIREPSGAAIVTALLNIDGTNDYTTWDGDGTADKPLGVNIGTPQPVFANENVPALLFIPTGKGTAETNQKIYVTVDYLVRTADPNLKQGYSEVEQVITNEVILNGQQLDPNKYYTLVMHLGMTSVKFEAVVTDWSSNTGDDFNEDGTITEQGQEETEVVWLPSNVVTNNIVATIANGNYFSNLADKSKVLTVKFNNTEVDDYTKISFDTPSTLPDWLEWDAATHSLKTKTANATADNKEATITVVYAADASADRPELKQDIKVIQYGAPALVITATPGSAAGGNMSAANGAEHVKLTVKLRGEEINIDDCTVTVATGGTEWLTWDATEKELKTAAANETNFTRDKIVTVSYSDPALGDYSGTITMTQASANYGVPDEMEIAKVAHSKSALLEVTLNGIDVTADVTVEIPTADQAWLKYNSGEKKFEALSEATAERSSTVTIKYGTLSKTVIVKQKNS